MPHGPTSEFQRVAQTVIAQQNNNHKDEKMTLSSRNHTESYNLSFLQLLANRRSYSVHEETASLFPIPMQHLRC